MLDLDNHLSKNEFRSTDFYSENPEWLEMHPEPIDLSGGRPNAGFYPIESIKLSIKDSPFQASREYEIKNVDSSTIDIKTGLQYGPSFGHFKLISFIKNLISELNKTELDLDYLVTNGSGDSLFRILQILLNPGDTILIEEFTYTPIFGPINALGGIKIPYKVLFRTGSNVIDIDYLTNLLENWGDIHPGLPKPKLIYTVPTQNPSGLTQPFEIKKQIYELSLKHDLIILEDDPDGYIRLHDLETYKSYKKSIITNSYLNFDVDGRVIRFETFSKLYSPGLRLGFIVCIKPIIDKLNEYTKVATKASSGFSQMIFYNTLQHWSLKIKDDCNDILVEGYLNWCYQISLEYSKRWKFVLAKLKSSKSYSHGYFEIVEPDGGMFFIIKINNIVGEELEKVRYKLVKYGVIGILGNLMNFENKDTNFIRLTLANVDSTTELNEAIERLDKGIYEYFKN